MKLTSRKDAKKLRLKRYFTGKPCKRGHVDERQTSNNTCLSCSRQLLNAYNHAHPEKGRNRARKWRVNNPEREINNKRAWRQNNPDYDKIVGSVWRLANPDKVKRYKKKWRDENPERMRLISKAWRVANPALLKVYKQARRAKIANAGGSHTVADIEAILKKQSNVCAGCGVSFDFVPYTEDHIVALSKGGSNNADNIQLMCNPCNDSKGSKSMADWCPPWDIHQYLIGE